MTGVCVTCEFQDTRDNESRFAAIRTVSCHYD